MKSLLYKIDTIFSVAVMSIVLVIFIVYNKIAKLSEFIFYKFVKE